MCVGVCAFMCVYVFECMCFGVCVCVFVSVCVCVCLDSQYQKYYAISLCSLFMTFIKGSGQHKRPYKLIRKVKRCINLVKGNALRTLHIVKCRFAFDLTLLTVILI